MAMPLKTPIAFCIFNRPKLTKRVFEAIAAAKPKQLFVIADGPRANVIGERELVEQTRAIINQVNWQCDVRTNFSNTNLGCKHRMASGIDWAFEQSEELIILEDDCLPNPSFFGYCEELLDRFQNDERVMMISGDNFQPNPRTEFSYYFSRWPHIWGWASWRRAWKHFDVDVSSWPELKQTQQLKSDFEDEAEYQHWAATLDRQYAGEIDTWDFPWGYACWKHDGLTILPEQNLISNIGFGTTATHTVDPSSHLANLKTSDIGQLIHPTKVLANQVADQYTWDNILAPPQTREPVAKRKWYQRLTGTKAGRKAG
jgi:hypothetical protein